MNAISKIDRGGAMIPAAEHEAAIRQALKTSLYPGASEGSVDMVLAYCRAAGLDPMQKPVHIVPMWDSNTRGMRDVVMPGIGLYRTNAARTGEFAGMSEPEFGPMITERIGSRDVTYPEWCRVTVSRQLPSGHIAKFTAVEYWLENYAIKGGKDQDQSPNAMWSKRVRGQLAKCTQAQALRMAFPEAVGAAPTAEEMEGKVIEGVVVDQRHAESRPDPSTIPYPDDDFEKNLPVWRKAIEAGKKSPEDIIAMVQTKGALTDEQREAIFACAVTGPGANEAVETEQEAEGQA